MRTLLVAALAAAAAAGEPRPAVMPVRSLRGGQLAQPASAEPPAATLTASPPAAEPDGGAALQAYLEAMGGFMERFSQLVDTATGTCKPNFFGMPPPSAAKIRSRPDRQLHVRHLRAEAARRRADDARRLVDVEHVADGAHGVGRRCGGEQQHFTLRWFTHAKLSPSSTGRRVRH